MHMLSFASIALVAFSGVLVSSTPINRARSANPYPVPAALVEGCKLVTDFSHKAGCSKCETDGKIVCGRDEARTTDLKCTKFSETIIQWIPIDNPGACGVFTPPARTVPPPSAGSTAVCASGKLPTGQTGCSPCKIVGNVVCGLDEDRTTDLVCTDFSGALRWVPKDRPNKCGVPQGSTSTPAY